MNHLRDADIGGAIVKRMCMGLKSGDMLTREQVLAIPGANRAALINIGKIVLYPRGADAVIVAQDHAPEIEHLDRHVVSRGFGKYDVIAGTVLNTEPLTKDIAFALAGIEDEPEPVKPARKTRKARGRH